MADWVEGRVVGRKAWHESLFSLEIDADLGSFKAGQFVRVAMDVEGERVGRPYSLVNAPGSSVLEIHFNEVPEGPLSPQLSRLHPGDSLWVSPRVSGAFTLEKIPPCENLWLMATGTAIGAYISILSTAEPWSRFKRIALVHGVRHQRDLSYGDKVASLQQRYGDQFSFTAAVSREQCEGTLKGRITDLIRASVIQDLFDLPLAVENSHVMLCGNSAMIAEMREVLEASGMRQNRANQVGQFTTEKYH